MHKASLWFDGFTTIFENVKDTEYILILRLLRYNIWRKVVNITLNISRRKK